MGTKTLQGNRGLCSVLEERFRPYVPDAVTLWQVCVLGWTTFCNCVLFSCLDHSCR